MDDKEKIAALEREVTAIRQELTAWRNLVVSTEAGGGRVVVGNGQVTLFINALTPSGVRVP
jgi:hypothetical protein